jgi:hypothetical protein
MGTGEITPGCHPPYQIQISRIIDIPVFPDFYPAGNQLVCSFLIKQKEFIQFPAPV